MPSIQNDTLSPIGKSFVGEVDTVKMNKIHLPNWNGSQPMQQESLQRKDNVTFKEADAALRNILAQIISLKTGEEVSPNTNKAELVGMTLSALEKVSINDLQLLMATLNISTFADSADASMKAMKLQTDTQKYLRDQQVQDKQDEIAANVKAADNAKKGSIVKVVFDWAVATAEVIYGAAKVAGGVLSGDAVAIAAGSAYILAGTAGLVKSIAETLILLEIGDKDKLEEVADIAGKVQMGFEYVAMALDIIQIGKGIAAARAATAGAQASIQAGTQQIATQISQNAGQEAIKASTQALVQEVSTQVAEQMSQQLSQTLVQEIVKKSVEASVKEAIAQGVTVATEQLVAQQMTAQISKAIFQEVAKGVVDVSLKTALKVGTMNAASAGGNAITQGVIMLENNPIREKIADLIQEQNWLEFCYQWFDDMKKEQEQMMKDAVSKSKDALEGASQAISDSGSISTTIASTVI